MHQTPYHDIALTIRQTNMARSDVHRCFSVKGDSPETFDEKLSQYVFRCSVCSVWKNNDEMSDTPDLCIEC